MDGYVPGHGDESSRPYSQDLSNVAVDPNGMTDSSWTPQGERYIHPSLFAQPMPVFHQQQYQPSPYLYAYNPPQATAYPPAAYLSGYASHYQQPTSADPYSRSPYGIANSQVSPLPEHVFQGSVNSFQFPVQDNNDATVSPRALDRYQFEQTPSRNDGSGQYQGPSGGNSALPHDWVSASPSYAHDTRISDGFYGNSLPPRSGVADNTSYRLDDITVSTQNATVPAKVNFGENNDNSTPIATNSVTPVATNSVTPNQQVRITHPDLLATTNKNPSARLKYAPFAALSDTPIELSISNKGAKIPVYKPRPNKNGEIIIPGRDLSAQPNVTLPILSSEQRASNKSTAPKQDAKRSKTKDLASSSTSRPVTTLKPATSTPSPRSEISSPEDESSASEDSYATEEEEMEEQEDLISNHRADVRPSDIAEAATWDAVGVTFISAHRRATPEETGNGINELEKLISRFRGDIKKVNSALALAKAEKPTPDINSALASVKAGKPSPDTSALIKDLAVRRKGLINILHATVEHGHIDILENLGKNEKLIAAFGSMLVECINDQDLAGELPKAILKLMSKITTLTDSILDKVKFFKVGKRFVNNSGDAEVKTMIEAIKASTPEAMERVSKEKKSEVEEKKAIVSVQQSVEKQKITDSKPPSVPPNAKRVREPDASDTSSSKPVKKLAADLAGVSAQKVTKASSTPLRTSPVFASLARSAQKHQIAAAKPTVSKPAVKPEPSKPVVSSTPRPFLADILASIQNPNPAPEPVPIPPDKSKDKERKDETPSEKAKREAKERRRLLNLRVRFPEKSELEEVHYFTHDQAEDEGRQGDLLRDANNSRSEGMMHRQQVLQSSNSSNSIDMNDGPIGEVEYWSYPELQEIDFSLIDQNVKDKNYATRAGSIPVDTPQQKVQHSRESTQLIVIYTDPNDIPNSPKEPIFEIIKSPDTDRYFRQPGQPWVVQRLQEIRQYGADNALSLFIRKAKDRELKGLRDGGTGNLMPQTLSGATSNLTAILNSLKSLSTQSQQPAPPQPAALQHVASYTNTSQYPLFGSTYQKSAATSTIPAASKMDPGELENLTRIAAMLQGKPYPPTEPPDWYKGHPRLTAQWWESYYRDNPGVAKERGINDKALQEPTHLLPPQMTQAPAQPQLEVLPAQYASLQRYSMPLPNSTVPAPPTYDSNQLLGILAGLQNAQNPVQPQQNDWSSGWAAGGNANSYDHDYASHTRDQGNPSRWDVNRTDNDNTRPTFGNQNQDSGQSRGRDGGYVSEERHSGGNSNIRPNKNGDYKRNTKPCKFWSEGKCAKGANCTFRHD